MAPGPVSLCACKGELCLWWPGPPVFPRCPELAAHVVVAIGAHMGTRWLALLVSPGELVKPLLAGRVVPGVGSRDREGPP